MLLTHGKIYLENEIIEDGYLLIEDEQIASFGLMEFAPEYSGEVIDLKGQNVLPGFIDQHIHGANGADSMDATSEAYHTMATFLPREGTTSFLATTMTQAPKAINAALGAIVDYMETSNPAGEAEILGIHLEGPFISEKHIGAQNPEFVAKPEIKTFADYYETAKGNIHLVTYAPEEAECGFTNYLRSLKVVPSAGHTDASFQVVEDHLKEGLNNLTHFHNAMTPHHHRNPGVVTAGFYFEQLKAEMIVDGIHLHPDVVRTTYKIKGADNIILITDAMRAKGLADGTYDLGGQAVHKVGKEARLENGALAGSVAEMNFVAHNMKAWTGCSFVDLAKMASQNTAKQLGFFDRKGSLAVGKDADIVVVNDDVDVLLTVCRGKIAFQN
ncbi:N-acetylglucosamine-6-phosphate deacetylase [Culicoidibacter larvae]|uniref:N-acetylglucosamine-6-phosphate deacetylase n=1 Tax=Culicoidibacter larvae TaxID=2579976 RepID=A0A5R8QCH4_9FIRM|nr:N-acetylglucosamine-6-phosphate deacetylase [Culicoidibacter larvae]TLG73966.1 N-acetylglucosamine-6-phosphate deacetylase [Culicoidibacter larvae]